MAGNKVYNPPPYYRPPTQVATRVIQFQSLVSQADPSWSSRKYREIEYVMSNGRVYTANPYQRGAYDTPAKLTTQVYTGPATLAAGDITGVGIDFVEFTNTASTPGVLTTRTGAQMISDITAASPVAPQIGDQWALRVNNLGASDLVVSPGGNVFITGNPIVEGGTFTDLVATIGDATVFFQTISAGNPYQSVTH